jgi:hypothetical protein
MNPCRYYDWSHTYDWSDVTLTLIQDDGRHELLGHFETNPLGDTMEPECDKPSTTLLRITGWIEANSPGEHNLTGHWWQHPEMPGKFSTGAALNATTQRYYVEGDPDDAPEPEQDSAAGEAAANLYDAAEELVRELECQSAPLSRAVKRKLAGLSSAISDYEDEC